MKYLIILLLSCLLISCAEDYVGGYMRYIQRVDFSDNKKIYIEHFGWDNTALYIIHQGEGIEIIDLKNNRIEFPLNENGVIKYIKYWQSHE